MARRRRRKPPLRSIEHINMEIKMLDFFSDLMKKHPERNPEKRGVWGIIAYADAVLNIKSPMDIFSCKDEVFLAYRDEMQKEFGLEILTPQEAEERTKREQFTTRVVDVSKDIKQLTDFAKRRRNYEKKHRDN